MTVKAALSHPPSLLVNLLKQYMDYTRERIVHVRTVYNWILFILIIISTALQKGYSDIEINLSANICFETFTVFIELKAAFLSK